MITSYNPTDEVKVKQTLHFHPSTPGNLKLWMDSSMLKGICPFPPAAKPLLFLSALSAQHHSTLVSDPKSPWCLPCSCFQPTRLSPAAGSQHRENRGMRWLSEPQGKMWEVTDKAFSTQILDHCLISQHSPQWTVYVCPVRNQNCP